MLPIIGSIFVTGIFTRSRNSGGVPGIVSQAAPFAEMKGLVMLQPSSCCRGTQLSTWRLDNKMLTSAEHMM